MSQSRLKISVVNVSVSFKRFVTNFSLKIVSDFSVLKIEFRLKNTRTARNRTRLFVHRLRAM